MSEMARNHDKVRLWSSWLDQITTRLLLRINPHWESFTVPSDPEQQLLFTFVVPSFHICCIFQYLPFLWYFMCCWMSMWSIINESISHKYLFQFYGFLFNPDSRFCLCFQHEKYLVWKMIFWWRKQEESIFSVKNWLSECPKRITNLPYFVVVSLCYAKRYPSNLESTFKRNRKVVSNFANLHLSCNPAKQHNTNVKKAQSQ